MKTKKRTGINNERIGREIRTINQSAGRRFNSLSATSGKVVDALANGRRPRSRKSGRRRRKLRA